MSNALARLRILFGDELFVRTASGMQPTAKSLSLARPIGEALGQIRAVLEQGVAFEPATARHRFTIAVTDYGDLVVVPLLSRALRTEAPGIDLAVRPITDVADSLARLEQGDIDALIGGHLPCSPRAIRHKLFDERFVCIRDASLADPEVPFAAADYLRLPHALFSSSGGDGMPGVVDAILAECGLKRRVAITLPHVMAVPFAVARTDFVATMAERVAHRFASAAGVMIVPLPYEVPTFAVDLLYARRAISNAALRWLIDLIIRTCASI